MRETARAQQAFNDYVSLGPQRSLDALAEHYCRINPRYTDSTPVTIRRLLARWSFAHHWQARLAEIAAAERAAIIARGIADRQNRVDALNDRWQRMQRVIAERAQDALMAGVAGGETGLLVAEPMLVKVYETTDEDSNDMTPIKQARVVHKYALDTGLAKALLDVEKQAAIELGQWEEKVVGAGEQFVRIYERDRHD